MARRTKCHVTFEDTTSRGGGPAAILWDDRGRALNAMNYARGHRFTKKTRAQARRKLMSGCRELAANLDRTGKSGYPLGGARRRKRRK